MARSGHFPGELQEGDLVGDDCTVVDYIGRGAMGHVYRVRHNLLNAEYALKMLSREQATEEASVLFRREAGALKILSHPNLVRIYDVGLHGGKLPYYAMELLVGRDLGRAIRDSGPLSSIDAAAIFREVCLGLGHVHAKGITHRDIKPGNIFLLAKAGSSGEKVKVVDFGIVSFTRSKKTENQAEDIHGTPSYMSPEQCMGQDVDARSDIYSLGCTMYETLTGKLPFSGKSPSETMEMQVRAPAPTLQEKANGKEFPAAWETIIAKTLAKNPADRYQSMAEISQKLGEVLSTDRWSTAMASATAPAAKSPEPERSALAKLVHSKPLLIGLGTVAGLAVLCCLSLGISSKYFSKSPTASAPPLAEATAKKSDTEAQSADQNHDQPVGPASLVSTTPFTSDVIDGGRMVRKFDLPTDYVIGWFRTRQSESPVPASGVLKFPMNVRLTFTPSDVVGKYPFCLKRFGPDDIKALKFEPKACDDKIFKATAHMTGVRRLTIAGCEQLTGAACETLKNFKTLTQFDASGINITGSQLAQADIWSKIEAVTLGSVKDVGPVLSRLEGSKLLQKLVLSGDHLQSAEFSEIGKMTQLQDLDLSQNKLTKQDLAALSSLIHLTDLHLAATGLTGPDLEPLEALKHLSYLDFSGNHMTLKDLAALTRTIECSELDLRDTDLNASIVENLKGYQSLKTLHIGSKKLPDADLKKIRNALPLVKVD